jgi:hypothetical protein
MTVLTIWYTKFAINSATSTSSWKITTSSRSPTRALCWPLYETKQTRWYILKTRNFNTDTNFYFALTTLNPVTARYFLDYNTTTGTIINKIKSHDIESYWSIRCERSYQYISSLFLTICFIKRTNFIQFNFSSLVFTSNCSSSLRRVPSLICRNFASWYSRPIDTVNE